MSPDAIASASGCPDFDYAPGQPNLYRMMCRKQALREQAGVEGGFELFRAQFGLPRDAQARRVPLALLQAVASTRGLSYTETGRAGIAFAHAPPPVVGDGNQREVRGVTRTEFVACLADATVRGRSNLVMAGGRLLLDAEPGERDSLDDEIEWDPMVFAVEGGEAWTVPAAGPPMAIPRAFSLLGAHSDFFGHWMCEYLPKYAAARRSGALPEDLPVLIDAHMPASHRRALELLYGPDLRIVEVPALRDVVVDRLWCAPALSYWPLHELRNERFSWDAISAAPDRLSAAVTDMVRHADRALGQAPADRGRVFLARRHFRHRRLLNAAEIEAIATERRFVVAYPEDHSFDDQVRLMRGADWVVAPEGSAVFLAMFAAAGATLAILSHPLTDMLADYNTMFGALGVRTVALTGPIERFNAKTPHDSDYRIDPDAFRAFLDRIGAT